MPDNLIEISVTLHNNVLNILGVEFNLFKYENIYIYGSGKASIEMAKRLKKIFNDSEESLKDLVKEYFIISNYKEVVEGIEILESSHPVPTEKSLIAASMMMDRLKKLSSNDLLIYLLSGGTSSLVEKPIDGVTIKDISEITKLMLKKGLSIDEINLVRKALSKVKDGGLAQITRAEGVVLVISDVINDNLNTIGSAPFIKSENNHDIVKLLKRYYIFNQLSPKMKKIIASKDIEEKRVENKKSKKEIKHLIIGNNLIALKRAKEVAESLNYKTKIISSSISGDVKVVSKYILDIVKQNNIYQCLLFGGETTVDVKGEGRGGRNTELLLWILKELQNYKTIDRRTTFLSIGTDGIDGNSDAAGGIVNGFDYKDDIDRFLEDNNSYQFLKRDDNLIFTGETGTNVMDIVVVLIPDLK